MGGCLVRTMIDASARTSTKHVCFHLFSGWAKNFTPRCGSKVIDAEMIGIFWNRSYRNRYLMSEILHSMYTYLDVPGS